MSVLLAEISGESVRHIPILLLIGAAVFGGAVGGKLFQRLRIPQIVGVVFGAICSAAALQYPMICPPGRDHYRTIESISTRYKT